MKFKTACDNEKILPRSGRCAAADAQITDSVPADMKGAGHGRGKS